MYKKFLVSGIAVMYGCYHKGKPKNKDETSRELVDRHESEKHIMYHKPTKRLLEVEPPNARYTVMCDAKDVKTG